ncbi:MAG: Asp-tRNA(Asn)/Glu-tRNA(Gln) amidotransferase subunit GatA [Actinobacteria bacterium]|nr:Asp-tRNA(Asn)/Glu-tRNA(Gln) amidotransferase subunit GatA [Actinomycetota bacterium]
MSLNLNFLPAHRLNKMLKNREISSTDIAKSILSAIEKVDYRINAYIRVEKDEILKQAEKADSCIRNTNTGDAATAELSGDLKEKKNGSAGCISIKDFTGIPIAVKDNICTKGITTTCASKILSNYLPAYNATVIERLNSHRFILAGKANMDEFAMGSSNENSYFGPVRNPWDLDRVPGGSSGGPAAAVSSGTAICSLGSDTGGSIRQPASLCGVVGLKPTYGLVSRYGLVAFASSLDQIGPITRDVRDSAILLNAICGWDENDSTSIKTDIPDYRQFLKEDIKGLRIGVPEELMVKEVNTEVKQAVNNVLLMAEQMGAEVEETSLSSLKYALDVYYIISPSEASSNLSRFDGVRYGYRNKEAAALREMYRKTRSEGFGQEVKRRIMIGTYCLSAGYYDAYYEKAQRVRTLIIDDFNKAFEKYDILISPTSPTTAFKIGEKIEDPLSMYLSDICTIPVNLAGLPAISIPVGLSKEKLPIGLQIIANTLREDILFRAAYSLEKAVGFNRVPEHLYK